MTLEDSNVRSPEFLSLNPNNKIPAIIDPDGWVVAAAGPGDIGGIVGAIRGHLHLQAVFGLAEQQPLGHRKFLVVVHRGHDHAIDLQDDAVLRENRALALERAGRLDEATADREAVRALSEEPLAAHT